MLRIIPSLAVLILLIPIMGTGLRPALTALVLLAVPPILMNTSAGFAEVPDFMIETGRGLGMTERQIFWKVKVPQAMPLMLAGMKTALMEIIASATIASKIGAGGLGGIILTGLGLNRTDLLLIGGLSVAILAGIAGVLFNQLDKYILKYKYTKRRERKLKKLAAVLLSGLLIFTFIACSSEEKSKIRIGSKDFTENLIVAEIYALALEAEGFEIERTYNVAGSLVHATLINDEIDLYPEYTGTGLLSILGKDMITDPQEIYDVVFGEYKEQFQVTWLDYSQANDGQGLVIRTAAAEEYGISTISDLQEHADKLRFASQGEFDERDDGMPALERAYGEFNWLSSKVYDNGLKYEVLSNDEADVSPAYTTEGQLVNTDQFTLLEDDKQVWPAYNLAPVVRDNVLETYPKIAEILNKVSASLDTAGVTELNAKVDVEKQEYEDVAKEYYETIQD